MKAIIINPAGGEVDRLFQYDKGCKIRFYIRNASDVVVDYSCTGMAEAATVEATADGDSYEAVIPDYVLEYGTNVTCHIGYSSADNRQMVDSASLTVERRTKPAGFITSNPGSALTAAQLDAKKLDVYQGGENAGKTMVVGADGNVIPSDTPTGQPEKGDPGENGKSAYEYAKEAGYTGTEI